MKPEKMKPKQLQHTRVSVAKLLPLSAMACAIALTTSTQALAQQKSGFLEEVTVTAQRRSEKSQDVPISITTLGAEALGKGDVQQLSDVMKLTPGLRFDNQGPLSQPTIRGVGTAVAVSGGGSNVGIYTDGFISPNPFFADSELLSVESVQVLKGPQGTLFGRNSTGGAILVTTAAPSHEARSEVEYSYGSYATQSLKAYATAPASETVAFDIAAQVRKSDGFVKNVANGDDQVAGYDNWMVRTGVLWDVSDQTSVLLRYIHTDADDRTAVSANGFEKDGKVYAAAALFGANVATKPNRMSLDFQPEFLAESDTFQLTVKHQLEGAQLTSYTQYRKERTNNEMDFDFSSLPVFHYKYDVNDDIFTQEFLLASDSDADLQWTTGLFFFKDDNEFVNNQASFAGAPFFVNGGSGTITSSLAGFGDVTYALTDNLFLTGGLRVSRDDIDDAYLTLGVDSLGNLIQQNVADESDTKVTPRVVLRYTPTDSSSVYASYTQGYKSALLNVGGTTLTGIQVDPEEIEAYEVGYKYAGDAVTLDMAAYYYDYKDLQVATFDGPRSLIENAATSSVSGLEAQLRWAADESLSFNVGASYVHAEYDKFDRSQAWSQCTDFATCGAGFGMFIPQYIDASGFQMQRSPEFTANLGVIYTTNFAGGTLDLSSTLYYTSDFYFDSSQQFEQKSYELLSARAEWTPASEGYSIALFGDNLTDSEYRSQVLPQQLGALSMWGMPTTVGVSLNVKFD